MEIKDFAIEINNIIKENERLCNLNSVLRERLKVALLELLQKKQEDFEKLSKIQRRDLFYKEHCIRCRNNSFDARKPCKRLKKDTGKPILQDNGEIYSICYVGCSDFEWD